jgi:hypothetical protein
MAEYPGHAAATEPRTCAAYLVAAAMQGMEPHWSSPVCSLPTGPAPAHRRLAPGCILCCVVRQCTTRGRCGPFHRKRTTPSGVISTLLATMQHHLVGCGSARAVATCSCLFSVQCSATNERGYSTCYHVLPHCACHACSHHVHTAAFMPVQHCSNALH